MKRLVWSLCVAFAAALLPGCPVTGDIGYPCRFVRQTADGGMAPVLESEIGAGEDVIAFGAIECEDFVCVRQRYAPLTGGEALGTCSARCLPTNPDDCKGLSSEANLAQGPFTCRALVLDAPTLGALCNDPNSSKCQIVGGVPTAYYCAQGATPPDGGT